MGGAAQVSRPPSLPFPLLLSPVVASIAHGHSHRKACQRPVPPGAQRRDLGVTRAVIAPPQRAWAPLRAARRVADGEIVAMSTRHITLRGLSAHYTDTQRGTARLVANPPPTRSRQGPNRSAGRAGRLQAPPTLRNAAKGGWRRTNLVAHIDGVHRAALGDIYLIQALALEAEHRDAPRPRPAEKPGCDSCGVSVPAAARKTRKPYGASATAYSIGAGVASCGA